MEYLVFLSLFFLLYIYAGYGIVLKTLCLVRKSFPVDSKFEGAKFRLSVIIAAHNEEDVIENRILNVLECDYPRDSFEVIVASDRSDDRTNEIVRKYEASQVMLVDCQNTTGKSSAQNQAIAHANGDIIVFTDADTRFAPNFLANISAPFSNSAIGAVDGHLLFESDDLSGVATGQGYYWNYELKLRKLETCLGILAVTSGGCFAVRRELLKPLPDDVGEDCIVPLDVVLQDHKVVHARNAVAYDRMEAGINDELRARARMTLRNWIGTWRRARLLNLLLYPGYAFSLWSHKILRWLSPFFLIVLTAGVILLAGSSMFWNVMAGFIVLAYVAGLMGWANEKLSLGMPVVSTVFSFFLANLGFLMGLVWAMFSGRRITAYR
ncbi:glycosyltransferase [Thiohalophilus sp.]|uniref:glycosyltransferase n=1 Tax=Thiohalophilus sp. TaxID=3028392 RepID=UPI002ACE23C3|nr:glycosyltransferase [Thiohalophilus sp.]MDZ7804412.1 glycosyltransferase [Thiohalophilus sp.]